MKTIDSSDRAWLISIFLIGVLVRLAFVAAPLGTSYVDAEREAAYAQIAQNFAQEDFNILHPRRSEVDGESRSRTSNLVETEFPFLPWLAAVLDRSLGEHAANYRVLSALCSIASLFAFFQVARRILERPGALAASALFAINPVLMELSGSLLPDGLMLLLGLLALDRLFAWEVNERATTLFAASTWLAFAILATTSALHLVFFFAFIVLRKLRSRTLYSPQFYVSACIALLPALVWYSYAYKIGHSSGLSLFTQGGTHFSRSEAWLAPWTLLTHSLAIESRYVFNGPGLVLLGMTLLQPVHKALTFVVWYASAFFFHCIMLETPDGGAYFHHAISVAPACILLGAGVMTFLDPENVYRVATRTTNRAARIAALFLLVPTLLLSAYRGYDLLTQRAHREIPHSSFSRE